MGLLAMIFMVFFLPNRVHATTATRAMASSYSRLVNHTRALSAEDDLRENHVQTQDELTAEERTINLKTLVAFAKEYDLPSKYLEGVNVPVHYGELSLEGNELMPLWKRLKQYPKTLSEEAVESVLIQEIKRGARFHEHGSIRKANGHSLFLSDPAYPFFQVPEARTGRENQLYDKLGNKMMAAGVVLNKQDQVLLISSSNLEKIEWILPKGGWEVNEDYRGALSRELYEEAGVIGRVKQDLDLVHIEGKRKRDGSKDPDSLWRPSIVVLEREDPIWPENARGRLWVPLDDAVKLLQHMKRTEMAKVVQNAMDKLS